MADLTLIGMFGLGVLGTCIQSVLSPFFPHEAKEKDVNDSTIGVIFGIHPIVAAVCSPLIGMFLAKIGRKRVLLAAALMLCISSFSFALVPYLDKPSFIAIGILSRFFQGIGGSGLAISIVAIISVNYTEQMEKMFGIQQTLTGMAMIIGPVIGLGLYEIGGFSFIFFVLSGVFFAGLILLFAILPKDRHVAITKQPVSWLILMSSIPLDCLLIAFAFGSMGSIEPLLGNFLDKEFGVKAQYTALVFIIPTVAYPFTVFVSSKFFSHVQSKNKLSTGLLIVGLSLLIVGPVGITGIRPTLFGTLLGLFGIGSGMALSMIPALPDMVNFATEEYPHIEESLISDRVSGLINLSMYLGKGVFAPLAGFLCDQLGFGSAMGIVGGMILGYLVFFRFATRNLRSVKEMKKAMNKELMKENELKETKKSFYLLEEDEV